MERRLIDVVSATPSITIQLAADELGLSLKQARSLFDSLRKKQILDHTGSRKSGFWVVVKQGR